MMRVRMLLPWITLFAVTTAARAAPDLHSHGVAPRVSPDGRTIAFLGDRGQGSRVFVIRADGSRERPLTAAGVEAGAPRWLPDGRLTFSTFAHDTSRLVALTSRGALDTIATVPGRNPIPLSGGRVLFATGDWRSMQLAVGRDDGSDAHPVSDGVGALWGAAVSKDGARVAYGRSTSGDGLNVWVMNVDGSGAHAVTHLTDAEGHGQMPAWSPDGKRLAIQVSGRRAGDSAREFGQIWIVDLESGKATRVTPADAPYRDEVPAWFPDGSRLAFQSDRTGRMEIWVMNVDGSKPRQVTR